MPELAMRWQPQPQQAPVVQSTAENKLVGGMRGGSKTNTIAGTVGNFARNNPGVECVLLREDLEDLKKTTLRELIKVLPNDPDQVKHHQTDKYIDIRSIVPHIWSRVWYVEGKDPESLLSSNISLIAGDEANQIPQATIMHLRGALRQAYPREIWDKKNPLTGRDFGEFPPYHTLLGSNPAPCWLMDEFPVTRREQLAWQRGEWGPSPDDKRKQIDPDTVYFPMSAKENSYNPPGYWERLIATYRHDPILLERYVYGVWEVALQGLVYELRRENRWNGRLPGDRLYQPGNPVLLGIDPSNGAGTYAVVVCQLHEGQTLLQIDEWAKEGGIDEDAADWLAAQVWADDVQDAVVDSAKPDSITRLKRLGLSARKCRRKEVTAQINAVRAAMRVDPVTKQTRYIMDEARCPRTKEEFGKRAYASPDKIDPQRRVSERPVKAYDHCLNGLEYLVVDKFPVARGATSTYRNPVVERAGAFYDFGRTAGRRPDTRRPEGDPLHVAATATAVPVGSRYRPPVLRRRE